MSYLDDIFGLKDKVAVITGGTGFLGTIFSECLSRSGVKTIILDLDEDKCKRRAVKLSGSFSDSAGIGCDVREKRDLEKSLEIVLNRFRKIDILVNCAAAGTTTPTSGINENMLSSFEEYDLDVWNTIQAVNLTGTFLCCQVFGKQMVKQDYGNIINISSIYGITAPDQRIYPDRSRMNTPASYSVSKGGIVMLTKYLSSYWGDKKIRVNSLSLGGVYNNQDDEFVKKYSSRVPLGRMARTEEVVGALLFLASDSSSYISGHNLVVDGGWTAW